MSSSSNSTSSPAATNTPLGSNISVQPQDPTTGISPVTLTFNNVTQSGTTTLTISGSGAASPSGFFSGSPARYYDLSTTAVFSGPISVCVNYGSVAFAVPPQLFHFNGTSWINVTSSVDTANHVACGSVTSLSPFGLFQQILQQSVTVAPSSASVAIGQTQNFTAIAHYSDNSSLDVTNTATWTSSDPTIATVTTGLANAVKVGGPVTITATQERMTGTASFTVNQATSTTALSSSSSSSVFGFFVKLAANVTAGGGTPTGTVAFKDSSTILGSSAVVNGQADLG
ncbi:MAG: hypothetical protein C5B53_12360, partial [Candidatus Melainabacteria bacterium]